MKDYYSCNARNGLCIWVSYGRVRKIAFNSNKNGENKTVTLERGTADKQDFLGILGNFMELQAIYNTPDFMELYLGLTDDSEAKEIAEKIYNTRVNKDSYPIDALKNLLNESEATINSKKKVGVNAKYGDAWSHISIEDGIVTLLAEGSSYAGRHVYRTDADFCKVLRYKLENLADIKPKDFMEFYHIVEGSDDVAFKIAEEVRKNKIKKTDTIFGV